MYVCVCVCVCSWHTRIQYISHVCLLMHTYKKRRRRRAQEKRKESKKTKTNNNKQSWESSNIFKERCIYRIQKYSTETVYLYIKNELKNVLLWRKKNLKCDFNERWTCWKWKSMHFKSLPINISEPVQCIRVYFDKFSINWSELCASSVCFISYIYLSSDRI